MPAPAFFRLRDKLPITSPQGQGYLARQGYPYVWSRSLGKGKDGGTSWVALEEILAQGSEQEQSRANPAHPCLTP